MKFEKLAVISDCIHMYDGDGNVVTENHIFRKQLQAIACLFKETLICCPFIDFSKDKVVSTYTQDSIRFLPLPNVGGNTVSDKIRIIKSMPYWFQAFRKANAFADIVYQRFPNNLNIPGAFYFWFKRQNVFATYTGTWKNYSGEPSTYRFQKWVLKKIFKGPVFIYTDLIPANKRMIKSFSPSFTLKEWEKEIPFIETRLRRIKSTERFIPVFITVGSLQKNKNQQFILEAFKLLHEEGFQFKLWVIGDGPLKNSYVNFIREHSIEEQIMIAGKKTDEELKYLYRQSDYVIQAPVAEGFGKVPIEGFCYGAIPILSNTAVAKEMTGDGERGYLFSLGDISSLASLIRNVVSEKERQSAMILQGRNFARSFTIDQWVNNFNEVLNKYDDFEV